MTTVYGVDKESQRYSVILRYDPENLELHERVVTCLSHLDPTAPERFNKTKITGRLIVKRNSDLATAKRLRHKLRNTGALCSVQKMPSKSPQTDERTSAPASQRETDPMWVQCPNCGSQQPPDIECRACGIIISKARPKRESAQIEVPQADKPPIQSSTLFRILDKVRQFIRPVVVLMEKIQHPIKAEKLTSWTRRVADKVIRCAMVFIIALVLQVGLLSLGKMLWFLYTSTTVGQYYLVKLPDKAAQLQRIVHADPLTLGWDTTLTALYVGILLGCAAQVLHLIRYLYESQGIIGKLVLWFLPSMAVTAWIISQQPTYPEFALSTTLVAVPILCMLSSCLQLARTVLPELGDFRTIMAIILENREKTWGYVIKKIRIWLDSTKKVY